MKTAWRKYRASWGWIALASLILTAAVGIYLYAYQPDLYESAVGLYLFPAGREEQDPYDPAVSEMLLRDCRALLENPVILQRTQVKLNPFLLDGMGLVAEGESGTHLVWLRVSGEDPQLCQTAATALGAVFVEHLLAVTPHQASVASAATEPQEPVGPNRPLILLAALGASFAGLSLLFLLFASKKPTLGAEDAQTQNLGIPLVAAIPDFRKDLSAFFRKKGDPNRILSRWVNRSTLEEVKALSQNLAGGQGGSKRWVVMASLGADEGKSSLTVLLGNELCNQGKRVLLIDLDCHCPTLGRLLGAQGEWDLADHLAGRAGLAELLVPTALNNLLFIDNLHRESYASQIAYSKAFEAFVDRMATEFDHVLVDTPPLSLFADAGALGSVLDGTLLVAAQHRLTRAQLQGARERLRNAHNRLLGLVFTYVPPKGPGLFQKVGRPSQPRGAKALRQA